MSQVGAMMGLLGLVLPGVVLAFAVAVGLPALLGYEAALSLPIRGSWGPVVAIGTGLGLLSGIPLVLWCRWQPSGLSRLWLGPTLVAVGVVLAILELSGVADFPNRLLLIGIVAALVAWGCLALWVLLGPALTALHRVWDEAIRTGRGAFNPRLGLLAGSLALGALGFTSVQVSEALNTPEARRELGLDTAFEAARSSQIDRVAARAERLPAASRLPPNLAPVAQLAQTLSDARTLAENGFLEDRVALVEYRRLAEAVAYHLSSEALWVNDNPADIPDSFERHIRLPPDHTIRSLRGEFVRRFKRDYTVDGAFSATRPDFGTHLVCWPFWQLSLARNAPELAPLRRALMIEPALWLKLLALTNAGNAGAHYPSRTASASFDVLDQMANEVLTALAAGYGQ